MLSSLARRHPCRLLVALAGVSLGVHAADAPLPYSAAVAARFAVPAVRYDTPGLQPGRDVFTSNAELRDALRALARGTADVGALARGTADVGALARGAADVGAPASGTAAVGALASDTAAAGMQASGRADVGMQARGTAVSGALARCTAATGAPAAGNAPPPPRLLDIGASSAGEPLLALHFSRGPGRPAVLLQGQQHGDEPAGSEALLALAQQLAAGAGPAGVLDRIDIVIVPRANPDGAAAGRRGDLQGRDINRDHLLLRTPEAQALMRLVQQVDPLLVVDAHEHTVLGGFLQKFNAVQRNDLLFQSTTTANAAVELAQATEQWFHQPLRQALAREGLNAEWYYTNPATTGELRLSMGSIQPDNARNVNGLANRIAILLETRGLGIGRLDIQRRVHSQVVALTSLLQSAAEHAGDLLALRRQLQAQVAAGACQGSVVVLAAQTPGRRELLMLDPLTGADKAVAVQWNSALQLRPLVTRARPCGYWISAESQDAVQRLRLLGLELVQVATATELQTETWQETARLEPPPDTRRPTGSEGGEPPRLVQVALAPLRLTVPAGSWFVLLNQPLANLAVAALEPDSPSSWFAQRLLPALGSAARVMAPVPR